MQNGNNNYCRNCGEKLPLKVSECPKCHTKIINKRVLTDDGYIVYIIGNIMCILFGFILFGISNLSLLSPIIFIIAYLIIVNGARKYNKVIVINVLHMIESILLILCILFLTISILSCYFRF